LLDLRLKIDRSLNQTEQPITEQGILEGEDCFHCFPRFLDVPTLHLYFPDTLINFILQITKLLTHPSCRLSKAYSQEFSLELQRYARFQTGAKMESRIRSMVSLAILSWASPARSSLSTYKCTQKKSYDSDFYAFLLIIDGTVAKFHHIETNVLQNDHRCEVLEKYDSSYKQKKNTPQLSFGHAGTGARYVQLKVFRSQKDTSTLFLKRRDSEIFQAGQLIKAFDSREQ